MHELSLVQGLFRQLEDLAREHKMTSVKNVRLEIGQFASIVIDSFQFAFEVLAKEYDLVENAELEQLDQEGLLFAKQILVKVS